jgi:hypothetical protein
LEQRNCVGNGFLKDLPGRLDAPYQINTFASPSPPPSAAVEMLELTPPCCFVTSLINTARGVAVKLEF